MRNFKNIILIVKEVFMKKYLYTLLIVCFIIGCQVSTTNKFTEDPVFIPGGSTYNDPVHITIFSYTSGATIRYTLDGSNPSTSSGTVYKDSFLISENTTVKAIAYKTGYIDSNVTSAQYVLDLTSDDMYSPVINVKYNDIPIAMNQNSTDIGSTHLYTTIEVPFTIENIGLSTLNLLKNGTKIVLFGNSAFSLKEDVYYSSIIAGSSTQFTLSFSPQIETTEYAVMVSIPNDDKDQNPFSFSIKGKLTNHLEMVTVEGGTFSMGWPGIAEPTHDVTLSDYQISKYEVSYALWYSVKEWATANGYTFTNKGREGNDGVIGAEPSSDASRNEPVTTISWYDAVKWCNALSEKEGLIPLYYTDTNFVNVYKTGDVNISNANVKWDAPGYRLPTEAEWEFAARNRGITPGNKHSGYDIDTNIGNCAWYSSNSSSCTHVIGTKKANGLGIFDMNGNVWEMCWDATSDYTAEPANDPRGPDTGGNRVIRGGGWGNSKQTTSARYLNLSQLNIVEYCGFRVSNR